MTSDFNLDQLLANGETRNTEFKRSLTERDGTGDRQAKLIAQLKLITSEGPGQFVVGIEDLHGKKWEVYGLTHDEVETSRTILKSLCKEAGIEILEETHHNTEQGIVTSFTLARIITPIVPETLGVNLVGRVNSGKTTLAGVLIQCQLDNGSGQARAVLLTYPQELKRGQTADLHVTFAAIDKQGDFIAMQAPLDKSKRARILDMADRIITIFDAPGHKEYAKTMIRSVLGASAQYSMVLVPCLDEYKLSVTEEQRSGIRRLDDITREHLLLVSNQELPFIVVINKIDDCDEAIRNHVRNLVFETIKEIGHVPLRVTSDDDIPIICREIAHRVIVPVFEVSCVTGYGLDQLRKTLSDLPSRIPDERIERPAFAYIDKVYRGIRGTNVVITGTVQEGIFKPGQPILCGPDKDGRFMKGRIGSIEVFKKRVERVKAGDVFGFDLKRLPPEKIRRGQIISDKDAEVNAVQTFDATIIVTRHPTRIRPGYEPVFHSATIQQPVIYEKIFGKEYLVVGDVARVRMTFKKGPEMLRKGDRIVTREANTRCIGTITELIQ
ncbi:MAG: GTP-binding protein [Candidatus Hermodarchaeia archaeon]